MKGLRLLQPFGNLYKADVDGEDIDEGQEPARPGECPWPDCPEPSRLEYQFHSHGIPGGCQLEFDFDTGQHRVVMLVVRACPGSTCLQCPLPRCRYDDPVAVLRWVVLNGGWVCSVGV